MDSEPLSEKSLVKIFKTDPDNPNKLIKREDKCHEFKKSYNNGSMASYLKTMAAFANHDGGYIIFGIKDSPRELKGLEEKALHQFNELPVEKLTEMLNDHFSPAIEWTNCVYQFRGKSFGVIYVYPLENKPTICKKTRNAEDKKYSLKEADIYYRYSGRSERIKYPELVKIIEDKRNKEESQWLKFLMKAAHVGVENASILDLRSGQIKEGGNRIVIDESLINKIRFVKEGHFVEKEGAPALRLVGDIAGIETGKVVYSGTKKVTKSIGQTEIIESFLKTERVDVPIEYIKRICSSTTGNLPVYYYIGLANITKETAINVISSTTARGQAKKILLNKVSNFLPIKTKTFPIQETKASRSRRYYVTLWEKHDILLDMSEEDLKTCISSLLYVPGSSVLNNLEYIKNQIFELYKRYYENSKSNVANIFRVAICYIDSVEFFSRNENGETR